MLVNSACRVLEGQCVRAGAGSSTGATEFAAALRMLAGYPALRAALGAAGRPTCGEYDWDVVETAPAGSLASIAPRHEEAR